MRVVALTRNVADEASILLSFPWDKTLVLALGEAVAHTHIPLFYNDNNFNEAI
jgi:hypothetical protein